MCRMGTHTARGFCLRKGAALIFNILHMDTCKRVELQIGIPEDLAIFAHAVNHGGLSGRSDVTVRLTADLDMTGFRWVPIGFEEAEFAGLFDGCGHTIRGLTIQKKGPGNYGLFGHVSGTVQNVTAAVTIQNLAGDPHSAVGGIAGCLTGGIIRNCAADFAVDGGGMPLGLSAGGVVGLAEANSLIQNCRSSVRMENIQTSLLYLGGIVGALLDSRAEACAFAISLTAQGGEGQHIQAGDVTGSIQGESALVNCVHWETADGTFFEREEAVT